MDTILFEKQNAVYIEEEMKRSYLAYAMSVIIGRALPDVRDGLKPVQRRILYSMHISGNAHNKPYKKSARIVGEVMGKFHPHGDVAIYDALVRMAQDFSMSITLIDGQGNFGSIDGDAPAAMRYTEVRLAKVSGKVLQDIEKETVDFIPNYDGEEVEPVVLPTVLPNLLINGSSGIAVGMATSIPTHNLSEVCEAVIALSANPLLSNKELMKYLPGPDFPSGGLIMGREGIIKAYETGHGSVKMRAQAHVETIKKEREAVVVTELPYQVNKATLVENIAALVQEKKIEGVTDIRDESSREGIRVVLELRKGEIGEVLLNNLYKMTRLETSMGIQMLAILNNQPKTFNLKEMLVAFIDYRKEVVTRATRFDLKKAEERAHILEGLKTALDHLDEVIGIIRESKTPLSAKESLMKRFSFSEIQAQAILDMKLQRLTGLEQEKILEEYRETLLVITRLKEILGDDRKVMKIITDELASLKKDFGFPRRTKIVEDAGDISIEELIPKEDMVVTLSHLGYIKRTPLDVYRSQRRGGKGRSGMTTREEDFVAHLFVASSHDHLLFFSDEGKVYSLRVFEVPEVGAAGKGRALVNLFPLGSRESIQAVLALKDMTEGFSIALSTKKGIVKKTPISDFESIRTTGKIAIVLDDGDSLVGAGLTQGDSYMFLATKLGLSILFSEKDVHPTGRKTRGVRGIRLKKDDEVVEMEVLVGSVAKAADEEGEGEALSAEGSILTVTERGFGKRTPLNLYRIQRRGGKGLINLQVTERNGCMVGGHHVFPGEGIMLITQKGQILRTGVDGISEIGRRTQGMRIITIEDDDRVMSIAKIVIDSENGDGE